MLFTKRLRQSLSGDSEMKKLYEHINYAEDTLEIMYARLEKRIEKLEKEKEK